MANGDVVSGHHYREPTAIETAFLRVATRGYPELERQIESCRIAEYDPTGWCYVFVEDGAPSPVLEMAEGPALQTTGPLPSLAELLLWTAPDGILKTIEIVEYGPAFLPDPYAAFVEAASSNTLKYPSERASDH